MRTWKIGFTDDAFKIDEERNRVGNGVADLTHELRELGKSADVLDRDDPFDKFLIPFTAYEKPPEGTLGDQYGIKRKAFHQGGPIILEHQQKSAKEFLKKLRGFGLLADVVGSGKTYEAGVVLSELAQRGLVTSLLLIVPDVVFDDWVKVIEKDFGLGKLQQVSRFDEIEFEITPDSNPQEPVSPLIVKAGDFVKWDENWLKNKLFSVVVVDEAHRLCNEDEASNEKAMKLLSIIMKTKRDAKRTYCLLLSATPHAGNLEDMFRLWYFIRFKGGDPGDFNNSGRHTANYIAEKEEYTQDVCRGATTVMEFVVKEKIAYLRGGRAKFVRRFNEYYTSGQDGSFVWSRWKIPQCDATRREEMRALLDTLAKEDAAGQTGRHKEILRYAMGVKSFRADLLERFFEREENEKIAGYKDLRNYVARFWNEDESDEVTRCRDAFERFLLEVKQIEPEEFDYYYEGNKHDLINEFLDNDAFSGDRETRGLIKKAVDRFVAQEYHDGVMQPIMIRRKTSSQVSKKKHVVNFMFFHTRKEEVSERKPADISLTLLGKDVKLHYDPDRLNWLSAKDAISLAGTPEKKYSLEGFVSAFKNSDLAFGIAYGTVLTSLLDRFGLSDLARSEFSQEDVCSFHKDGSIGFYANQMQTLDADGTEYCFVPVYEGKNPTKVIDFKLEKLKQILTEHAEERIIIFFDYGAMDDERPYNFTDIWKALDSEDAFRGRLLPLATEENGAGIKAEFDEKDDAILIVNDERFTEGANFQKCSVIVNFEVTPNPIGIQQSIGRVFRYGQERDVTIYSLADMHALEGYVLAYFTHVGLMGDKNGEAEILAGCNNDNMVTIRCPACKKVRFLSQIDYELAKKRSQKGEGGDDNEIYCRCKDNKPKMMTIIGSDEYVCDNRFGRHGAERCYARFLRKWITTTKNGSKTYGYTCYNPGYAESILEQKEDSTYSCKKSCLIRHCSRFAKGGPLYRKCKAIEKYETNPNASPMDLFESCRECPQRKASGKEQCFKECWVESSSDACTSNASSCTHDARIGCRHAPQVIRFTEEMTAPCPCCGKGTLRPVRTRTFETFIRKAFEQKDGEAFCFYFQKEIRKIDEVKEILEADYELL